MYRTEKQVEKERTILNRLAKVDDEAAEGLLRLIELDLGTKDYKSVMQEANTVLEINPLHPLPYRARGEAQEHLGSDREAIESYRTVIKLDPPDRPEIHFRLARLLKKRTIPPLAGTFCSLWKKRRASEQRMNCCSNSQASRNSLLNRPQSLEQPAITLRGAVVANRHL